MIDLIELLAEKINAADNIVIITHNNPDPDALGSSLALSELIRDNFGKNAPPCFYTGTIPNFINWLPHRFDWVKLSSDVPPDFSPDLAIMMDSSGGNTGNESMEIWERSADTVKIDHHKDSPSIALLNIHKIINSTAQLVLEIAQTAGWKISVDVATNLYAGISGDTGRFKWVDSADVFIAAAECMRLGANPRAIEEKLKISDRDNIILNAEIIKNSEFYFDGQLAVSSISKADYPKLDGKGSEAMEWLRRIDTVEYVILLKEPIENYIHVSLRSNCMPVNIIARKFGGGGHINAAAFRFDGSLEDAKTAILKIFAEMLQ
ncbi:MAG: bifunctional oligoribonuclease/PAP phosphatase NrnA [Alphaproteobacteria bacterium]|nr:bifunctional oligoribonuclease/PAP phosphatase NrnA [Alphaproteobacteria bacterium]